MICQNTSYYDYVCNEVPEGVAIVSPETEIPVMFVILVCSIRKALEPLDSKYRLIVLLYYMEGFSVREISDVLDMKESTVKSRLHRGRKQIAEIYGYKVKEGRA